jgi:hypothetical protein
MDFDLPPKGAGKDLASLSEDEIGAQDSPKSKSRETPSYIGLPTLVMRDLSEYTDVTHRVVRED